MIFANLAARARRSVVPIIEAPLRALRIGAFLALDSLCRLVPAASRNTAVVVRLDAIGDFFMWMQGGAVDAARYARGSDRRVVLLANHAWADYARRSQLWDDVVSIDPRSLMHRPLYRLAVLWRVRRLGARLLIQPRAARVFLQEDAIARVSGAELRVGSAGTLINTTPILQRLGNRFYDKLVPVDERQSTHESVRNDQFVVGLTGKPAARFEFRSLPTPEGPGTVAVALGAGHAGRVWPVGKLAELLMHVRRCHPSLRMVLLGADADRHLAERLRALAGSDLEDRVGRTELHAYVEAIASARLVICNDSSAYHIAMAFDRKVLCFLGGGHFGWYAPYPPQRSRNAIVLSAAMTCFWCNWRCPYPRADGGAFRCVASIPLESAVEAAEALLGTAIA